MTNILKRAFSCQYMLKDEDRLGDIPSDREGYKRAINMAWPSIIESVLLAMVTLIDTLMVSSLGEEAVAAVGITSQPRLIVLALIFSLNIGVTAVVARRKGQMDQDGANRCLKQCLKICAGISILLAVLCTVFSDALLRFAGAGEDYIRDASTYFRILMMGIFFNAMSLTINAAQRGAGNTKISMRSNLTANLVNLVLNYFLINGHWIFPKWGVAGAAVATSVGYVVAFGMSLASICHRRDNAFLSLFSDASWKWDKATLASVYKVSSSAVVEQFFMRVGFFLYAKIVAGLGTTDFATHQVCMNIMSISFGFGDGFNVASSSLVGQSLGAKRPDMAKLYASINQRMAMICSTVLALVLIVFRYNILSLFSEDPLVIKNGGVLLIMIACVTHAQTSQVIISGSLRGAGDTKFVAICSMLSIALIRPALSWLMAYPLGWGLFGAWIAVLVDQYLRLVLFFARFRSGEWTKIEL